MKRLTYTLFLFLFLSIPLSASHIVGGEIELLHLDGFLYRLNLIYYFDVRNNPGRNPQAEEGEIELYIFRKSDNAQIRSVTLRWLNKTRVPYTQPNCSMGEIISDKIIYTNTITLPAIQYSDPGGYYITWARCCRNYSIQNIFSQDPTHAGAIGAGQTFYLEFPPVSINGQQFVNSSPRNFPALNDYACPTKPYYVDFAGVDDDGDSLAYSLVTPLSTVTVTPSPPPTPRPYPDVKWLPGYGLDKIVNGERKDIMFPDLAINNVGFLRVTPRSQGLFVFAVKVEEFRNNVKIGEVRRDFQMLVTDCRLSAPPVIKGKELSGVSFKENNLSVSFANSVTDTDRCIVVSITDPDATRASDNFQEMIQLRVIPLNFKAKSLSSILPQKSNGIISGNGSIEFNLCFPACPYFEGGPYQIGVIAYDDACALPLTDTLKVEVEVEPPHNERAKFVDPAHEVFATVNEGDKTSWPFEAHDAEGEELLFFALTDGFSITKSGMKTDVTSNGNGVLKGKLDWDAFCDIYDFTKRTDFTLRLLVDDVDQCDLNDPDTAIFHLNVILPEDADPIIDTDLTPAPAETEIGVIEKRIFDVLTFNVKGTDLVDNDLVTLKIAGDGFKPLQYGMSFPTTSAAGTVSSVFSWDLACDKFNLEDRSEFNIGFVAIDSSGKCRVRKVDSLVVKVKVLKPHNVAPNISIVNMNNEVAFNNGNATVAPGQLLNLQLNVSDGDTSPKDRLTIDLVDMGGDAIPEGWSFQPAEGPSVLSSVFTWGPQCSIFQGDVYENDYYFDFRYSDNRCATAEIDTIRVKVKVKDVESESFDMSPANVFTPNGDNYNDYYSMERRDESGNLINILPPDNCRGAFESIRIYNRWGRMVFSSRDRNFRWLGLEEAAGVYFYYVAYTNKEFKGTVSLRD